LPAVDPRAATQTCPPLIIDHVDALRHFLDKTELAGWPAILRCLRAGDWQGNNESG